MRITTTATPAELVVTFFSDANVSGDSQVAIRLAIDVIDPSRLDAPDKPFRAYWRLIEPNGSVRFHGFVDDLSQGQRLEGSNARVLASWHCALEPGHYQVSWGAPGYGSTLDTFDVIVKDGRIVIENFSSLVSGQFPPQDVG
jgi:hypothetical protein